MVLFRFGWFVCAIALFFCRSDGETNFFLSLGRTSSCILYRGAVNKKN